MVNIAYFFGNNLKDLESFFLSYVFSDYNNNTNKRQTSRTSETHPNGIFTHMEQGLHANMQVLQIQYR